MWQIPDYESGGQEFESLRARHQPFDFRSEFLRDFLALDIHDVWGSTGAARELISLLSKSAPLSLNRYAPNRGNGSKQEKVALARLQAMPETEVVCILS